MNLEGESEIDLNMKAPECFSQVCESLVTIFNPTHEQLSFLGKCGSNNWAWGGMVPPKQMGQLMNELSMVKTSGNVPQLNPQP